MDGKDARLVLEWALPEDDVEDRVEASEEDILGVAAQVGFDSKA
jgi:hypothetical protein